MSHPNTLPHDWYPRPVPENVVMGQGSWLHSAYAFHHYQSRMPAGVRIGHDTGIYIGTVFCLGADASVEIGNYCTIAGAIISSTSARVIIGDYAFISYDTVLADSYASAPPDVAGQPRPVGDLVIGENVWIGARAVILGPLRIGNNAIIGASSVVDCDVPENAIVAGNPARVVGWATGGATRESMHKIVPDPTGAVRPERLAAG